MNHIAEFEAKDFKNNFIILIMSKKDLTPSKVFQLFDKKKLVIS